jgi:hypothetical protein
VRAGVVYLSLVGARTRSPLPALAAVLFALIGTYAGVHNEVGSTFALTSLMSGGLAAWLVFVVLAGEPQTQADMATVALGGRSGRLRLEALLVAFVAGFLTALFIAYPLVLSDIFGRAVFNRTVEASDLILATVAHLGCALLGGSTGVLFAPPRIKRRASACAAISGTLLVLVGAAPPKDISAGPIALARALDHANGNTVSGSALLSSATCLLLATVMLFVAAAWTRRVA